MAQKIPGKRIVWLASYPKSGNTWLRLFLENLLRNSDEPLNINQPREFTGMGDMTPFLFDRAANKPLDQLDDKDHVLLRKPAHEALSAMTQTVVFAKTHTANIQKFGVPLFHPQTTRAAIYIVRNPLDVVDSLADHWGLDLDRTIAHMANVDQFALNPVSSSANNASPMKGYLSSWSVNVKSWVNKPPFPVLLLKYEDMLENPKREFSKVVKFLNAPFNEAQIDRALNFSSFKEVRAQEDKGGFEELSDNSKDKKFFRHGKAERWRDVLSRAQTKRVVKDHKEVMKKLGYDTKFGK